MTAPGSSDARQSKRLRRLRRLQLVVIAVPTLVILVAAMLMAQRIRDAGDARSQLRGANGELASFNHELQVYYQQFWRRRAQGAERSVPPEIQARFLEETSRFRVLADERSVHADERPSIDRALAAVTALSRFVLADPIARARNAREEAAAVERASTLITELDDSLSAWSTIVAEKLDRRATNADSLIVRLFAGLGILIALLVSVATTMWIAIDRKRRAAIAEVRAEHDSGEAVMQSVQDGLAVLDEDGTILRCNRRLAEITGIATDDLVGARAPWLGDLPVQVAGETEIVLEAASSDEPRYATLTASRLPEGRGVLNVLEDITLRRAAEAELHNLSVEREVLRRVATFVAGGADPSAVFDLVACETATLLGADAAVVTRFDLQTDRTVDVGVWVDPLRGGDRPPTRIPLDGGSPTAIVFQTGRAASVVDFADADPVSAELLIDRGFRSGAAAPVQVGSVRWGAVAVLAAERGHFPAGVEDRLARFAELVGLTVANADARARLASQAATDPLTGLANHRSFHERLETEVARARHDQTDLALVMIDLDNFKAVNDTFGHNVGDAVLTEAARRVAGEARFGEVVARVGGEEFAWILPGSDGLNAWRAAERARRAVAELPFGDGVGHLTASAGVADLNQAADAATLMRLADGALYWAKASGRDATFRYSPDVVRELSATERAERLARTQAVTALRALARAVDAKDPSTARHSERVAAVAVRLGRHLGWDAERLELLREAALLHDVGKIGVPDSLLFKPDRLTGLEKQRVEGHANLGAEIVSDVLSGEQVAWVRGHHERWDGLGYPDRLEGEGLPMGARIIAVADAWDAMTSVRTYGTTRDGGQAISEIERQIGTQFCPVAAAALIDLWNDGQLEDDHVGGWSTSTAAT